MSKKYEEAGVSLEQGYASIEKIRDHIASTKSLGFNGDIGGFGGLFNLYKYAYKEPVLVSGTDGVGTKLLLAIQQGKIDSVGIDLVAMCVNDIITSGADPLFFLDYIAVGKNSPDEIQQIVSGITTGCLLGSLSLIGGETAEMPGMYLPGHFDLAGFAVGVVEQSEQITGAACESGDVIIGIPSSGIHSNGYSLVRKILRDASIDISQPFEHTTLQDYLLEPTRIYVDVIAALKRVVTIHGMSHITGGGLYENLPRMLQGSSLGIELNLEAVQVPPIFEFLRQQGELTLDEMYHVFNMGIGYVVVVQNHDVERSLHTIHGFYPEACVIGQITSRKGLSIR
jgi:phosphoribosylformylglycinamidine cyclo-ligase